MVGKLRLISGLVLFVFVLGHFINHTLGIVSLSAMDNGLKYTVEPWRTPIGTFILGLAFSVHVGLAVWSLYLRRTFKMRRGEALQLVLGFLIPLVLASHVMATRGGHEAFGLEEGYSFHLYAQWINDPFKGLLTSLALLVVWVHACLGWHFWLRLKPWYHKVRVIAFAFALAIPLLALAGIISGGFRVLRISRNEKWVTRLLDKITNEASLFPDFVLSNAGIIQYSVLGTVSLIFVVYFIRKLLSLMPGGVALHYRDVTLARKHEVKLRSGSSVLDLLKQENIPHASVCGGRGRCSTCRVRIDDGSDLIASPSGEEQKVLNRIGAPPNVRLACQIVPVNTISVTALLHPQASARDGFAAAQSHSGDEQDVAVLFADIRAFTKLSETQLPYDTAFLLNRYFAAMGKAIEDSGGHLDKFIGDGVMALFGIDKPLDVGASEAIAAAKAMSIRLQQLNEILTQDIEEPLKIGIGIHCGKAIVGNMGYNRAVSMTAIGDVVNTASRLENLTKEFEAQLVVSQKTVERSGMDFSNFPSHEASIRGRLDALEIYAVEDASTLSLNQD